MKKLALFDFDNTLYEGLSVIDIAKEQTKSSSLSQETFDRMENLVSDYRQGSRTYEDMAQLLLEEWAAGLEGEWYSVSLETVKKVLDKSDALFGFVPELLDELRDTHALHLITASPGFTAEACKDLLALDGYHASAFTVERGIFTGKLGTVLGNREQKFKVVSELLDSFGRNGSLAFGDSEGDIAMLDAVETPFGINASEGLRTYGTERSWHLETPETVLESVRAVVKRES